MKNNIIKGFAAVAALGLFASCSSDYLDLAPETEITNAQVTQTTDAAALAINGLSLVMNTQWGGLQSGMSQNANGENLLNDFYGEAMGADMISSIPCAMWGPLIVCGGSSWSEQNYVMNYLPWKYSYTLIQMANTILAGIDEAEGTQEDRDFIKAQALTFRAHGYTRLLQFYAPRWEDSENGEFYMAVERLDGSTGDAPLITENRVFEIIYNDLNTAIDLYKSCGKQRVQKWHPDVNVAYGILARAALIKHDWATAKEAAHNARQGYSIMDNNTYLSGFINDNASNIWVQSDDASSVYYFSFGAHYGVNGAYVQSWGYGAGAISLDLYNQLDEKDIRRQMFLTPDKVDLLTSIDKKNNPGGVKEDYWWNNDLLVPNSGGGMDVSKGPKAKKDAKDGYWGLYNVAAQYCKYYGENVFTGDYASMNNEGYMAYYTYSGKQETNDYIALAKGYFAKLTTIFLGSQFKFWGNPPYGTTVYPFMRSEEMCLIEAEAAYELGDEGAAKSCLMEINGKRIPGYTCDKSGTALRDEIRLCRRIELWGEGFSFPDFKRWSLPIQRTLWKKGVTNSGNWTPEFAHDTPVKCNHGWRMLIPQSELNFNKGIDRTLLIANDDPNLWTSNPGEEK